MTVTVAGWSEDNAVAFVDGVRVRIRRYPRSIRWLCDVHGTSVDSPELCSHTRAFADTPVDQAKRNHS